MARSFTVNVEPKVLTWLRESSGWKKDEVGKRLGVSSDVINDFESGKRPPTMSQLKHLSQSFKYPLSTFYLPEPRKGKPLPKDYRFLSSVKKNEFDKKTLYVIRDSRSIQNISKELSLNIRYSIEPEIEKCTLSDRPEQIATRYREVLELDWDKQRKYRDGYQLFRYLRDLFEDMNILALQFSMPLEDARGFALADERPIVIVVNTMDTIEARLFTLMHEFAHALLRDSAIDMPGHPTNNRTERWCNKFAATFLLPEKHVRELFEENLSSLRDARTLNILSKKVNVSKSTLLIRMRELRYITESEYVDATRNNILKPKIKKRRGGGQNAEQKCMSSVGNKYVSLVARNYDKRLISTIDAAKYLSIKLDRLDGVLRRSNK